MRVGVARKEFIVENQKKKPNKFYSPFDIECQNIEKYVQFGNWVKLAAGKHLLILNHWENFM